MSVFGGTYLCEKDIFKDKICQTLLQIGSNTWYLQSILTMRDTNIEPQFNQMLSPQKNSTFLIRRSVLKKKLYWGAWVVQSVKPLTLDLSSGHDLSFRVRALHRALP